MSRITSPFGWETTAAEVAAGHHLSGKRAIITGATAGLGVETARVMIATRTQASGQEVTDELRVMGGEVELVALDLSTRAPFAALSAGNSRLVRWKWPT